ncbi:hypothetical protein KEM63_01370 [Halopseudomonas nanhaiensis]|uniref:hypothetical protein n=1 Tax=Halopseudomonas nanhaiensis TaxID=2830842 RepID=UPI001CBF295F|nr:hypothetical protein [Halopseudomonas nanhaiensis]UAW98663.1 hypothetical protein KEM63_01370 [Halopseudomonas nanhaiensis]
MRRLPGCTEWSATPEAGLLTNPDPSDFYRRAAGYIGSLAAKGVKIHYRDAQP